MTTKHTPGPWIVSGKTVGTVPPENDFPNNKGWDYQSRFIKTESGQILAQTMSYTTDLFINDFEQEEANARLIAAAPELLEALQYLLDGEWAIHSNQQNEVWITILDKAKSAIAKATNQKEEAI